MKFLYTILFIGLAMMAYAQTQTPDQSNAPSATSQQSNAQLQVQQQSSAQTQTQPQPGQPSTTTQRAKQPNFHRWEVGGGYSHITGNGGLNGFNVGGSVFLDPKISLGFNYDSVYDNTILGTFAVTNVGLTVAKNHLQNFLTG